jgi:hypothetical protein
MLALYPHAPDENRRETAGDAPGVAFTDTGAVTER